MVRLGLAKDVVDEDARARAIEHLAARGIELPSFAELADPTRIPADKVAALADVGPDDLRPENLFRVHWHNDASRRGTVAVPEHVELPRELTGVDARIVVLLGDRFPLIGAHKVLAAYACLVPRLVTGQFDPTHHRAVWPSTGNYCRGGVAIARILGCRGVAVLPAGMSRERFAWLEATVEEPADIVRTPGSESNVKEIYDECKRLGEDARNVIFNQFCEFPNHLMHVACTGRAGERVVAALGPEARLRAFVSATGSAGTIGAGDYLKEACGSITVAVEALECPTLSANGFGEHNIQGIGDKHVPLIHNVMSSDVVVAVSDRSTDRLGLLFAHPVGRAYLTERRGIDPPMVDALASFGPSSICNVLAAIKVAKHMDYGPDDVLLTVATDGAALYATEHERTLRTVYDGAFDAVHAGEVYARHLAGVATDHLLELTHRERERIFNLGYFTWVEQQGITLEEFEERRAQAHWTGLRAFVPVWDELIADFNAHVRASAPR